MVVKIDNARGARPQTGFNAADIVYEEIVNDSLTRFADGLPQPGQPTPSARSAPAASRTSTCSGRSTGRCSCGAAATPTVTNAIRRQRPRRARTPARRGLFRAARAARRRTTCTAAPRRSGRRPPPSRPAPPPPQFAYRDDGEAPLGVAAGRHRRPARHHRRPTGRGTPSAGVYRREMNGQPHVDAATGEQITTDNVVVLEMEYAAGHLREPGRPERRRRHGLRVDRRQPRSPGTWTRADRLDPFGLFDADGAPIELTPGRTFIELAPARQRERRSDADHRHAPPGAASAPLALVRRARWPSPRPARGGDDAAASTTTAAAGRDDRGHRRTDDGRPTTTTARPTTTTTHDRRRRPPRRPRRRRPRSSSRRMPLTGVPLAFGQVAPDRPALAVKIDNVDVRPPHPGRPEPGRHRVRGDRRGPPDPLRRRVPLAVAEPGRADPQRPQPGRRHARRPATGRCWRGAAATPASTGSIAESDLDRPVGPAPAAAGYYRGRSCGAPHNLFNTTDDLWAQAPPEAGRPTPLFSYLDPDEAPVGADAAFGQLMVGARPVRWDWDAASGTYLRSRAAGPTRWPTAARSSTNNVVVLVNEYRPTLVQRHQPRGVSVGTGAGLRVQRRQDPGRARGRGPTARRRSTCATPDGAVIELTPGRTWVEMADVVDHGTISG